MLSQILHTPNHHHRALDSAVPSHPPSIFLKAKEYDMDNDPSASLLRHSPPSFQKMSFNKPTLPRASSFTTTRNKASRTRHCFYQKRRWRAASQDSLTSVSVDTASTTTAATSTATRSSFGREVASETFLLTHLGFKMFRNLAN